MAIRTVSFWSCPAQAERNPSRVSSGGVPRFQRGSRSIEDSPALNNNWMRCINWKRFFSTHIPTFPALLDRAKEPYLTFQNTPNEKKARLLALQCLSYDKSPQEKPLIHTLDDSKLKEEWIALEQQKKGNFPKYVEKNLQGISKDYQNVYNIHDRDYPPLLHREIAREQVEIGPKLDSTEFDHWFARMPSVPFTRHQETLAVKEEMVKRQYIIDQLNPETLKLLPLVPTNPQDEELLGILLTNSEEDAFAMYLMLLPYLNPQTLIHEIGSWNGQNLLNIAMYAHLKGRTPAGCIGTDINPVALNFAKSMTQGLGLGDRYIKFGLAHALVPLDLNRQGISHKKQTKVGIRLLPVFDQTSIRSFLNQLHKTLGKEDIVGLSYALQEGSLFTKNSTKARNKEEGFVEESFEEGITISAPIISYKNPITQQEEHKLGVLNTYFSEKGFRSLIFQNNLSLIHHLVVGRNSDNLRGVCLLQNK